MSYSIPVVPRSQAANAFQLVIGETTATQIRDFVGEAANVGVANDDERDLRWVHIRTVGGWQEMSSGDWIVHSDTGAIDVVRGEAFRQIFVPAGDHAREKLRTRDVNDPRVQEAQRLAQSFAKSLRPE